MQQEENKEGENKEGENDIYLPSDPSVSKDTVEKNVESLTAVEYDVDPLDWQRGSKQGEEPRESK